MKPVAPPPASAEVEISRLTALLQKTGRRLEALTGGEVDSVVDRTGRVFLLKGVQAQLRRAEDSRQAAVLNALPAHIAMLDAKGIVVSANDVWRKFAVGEQMHYPGHAVGIDYLGFCDRAQGGNSADARRAAQGIRSVLAGHLKNFSLEYPCRAPADQRWFLMTATPLAGNPPNGVVVMHLDITDRKRGEQELRAFGAAMDALADAIYLVDRTSMQFVHVNDTACRMTSKTQAELMALKPWEILSISRAELERAYDTLIASGVEAEPVELLRPRADGGQAWVELRRHALRSGDRWTIVTLVRDVSERKRLEEEQRATLQLLDNIVENIPTAVQVKSVRDGFRIQMWNRAAEELYGLARVDAIGRHVHDLWPEADADRMHAADLELLVTGRTQDFPDRLAKTKTRGDIRVHLRKVALFDAAGTATHLLAVADDMTAQLANQARLRESESRFRSLTMLSSDWFWEQDEEHRLSKFSGGEGVAGWGPDQGKAVGLHRWDLGGVVPISSSWEEHKGVLDAHKPFRKFEYSRILDDGRLQYVEASGEPIFDAEKRFTGYRGVATEITERKLAESDMQRQQSELRALFDLMPAMIWFKDTRNRILRVNSRAAAVAGKAVAEIEGKPSSEIYPQDFDRFYADDQAVIESGKSRLGSVEALRGPNGVEHWIQTDRVPYFDHGGKVIGIVVMAQDITERKHAEQELKRFRAAMDSSGDAIVLIDRTSMRYVDVNQTLCDMVGYTRQEVVGMTPMALFGVERKTLERDYDALIADTESASDLVEGGYRHRDGTLIQVESRRRALRTETGWLIVATARDITDRKESEQKLRRLNRVYSVLSGINNLIVHVRDRDELFREACRIAVEAGAFKMAWIGVIDRPTLEGKVVAWHGGEKSFLDAVHLTAREGTPSSDWPGSRALRLLQPSICNDVATDPSVRTIRDDLLKRGHMSAACFPLTVAGRREGVLCLFAGEPHVFDDEETRLLTQLSGDISWALEHIEKSAKLARTSRVNAMLSGINGAIVRHPERNSLFREVCRIAVVDGGFSAARVIEQALNGKARIAASSESDTRIFQQVVDDFNNDPQHCQNLLSIGLRTGQVLVSNDVANDTRMPNRAALTKDGNYAVALLPIIVEQRIAGTVILRSREPGMFDAAELHLLREIISNLSFALEHIEKEAKVRRLTRVYAVMSGINTLIVRVRDRDELFNEACRIAVEQGRFTMAWLGMVDRSAMMLVPVASAGATQDHLALVNQRFSLGVDAPPGNVFSARAIREKKIAVSNDVQNDPDVLFKEEHALRGSRSMAMLPLQIAGEVVGILALYSGEIGFFDEEELKLLNELAGDVAFAIENLRKQERLDYLAYYDVLTGLANRTLFLERVSQYMRSAVAGGHKMAVFLIDMERFRNINDSLGRPAGDALLKQVAAWLEHCTGDPNLLARIGADHFALVLPEIKPGGSVTRLIDKTMASFMEHSFQLDDAVLRIAVKAGVALFPDDGGDVEALLRNAEAALKRAKASGERYVFYKQRMNAAVAGELTLENQLRQALENGEYVLHYQPKVNLASGKLTSCEALIRWNDPRTGLVPPGRFIPVLEETGLIYDVGRWALRQAIADYLRWRAAGLPAVRIAVNVSPLQLRSRGFVEEIRQVIGIDAAAAAGLELEITESLIMEDVKRSIETLQAIRAMGVTIAIDDFGTGFSSLSYLAKLPVDTLKIDRSFVIDMTAGPEGLALVSTVINLAHSLKLKGVAEGVETEEQSRLLRLLRCDEMQGFLFSKPVPAEVFEVRFLAPPAAG